MIEEAWVHKGEGDILHRLGACSERLQSWSRDQWLRYRRMDFYRYQIRRYKGQTDDRSIQKVIKARGELSRLMAQQEEFWKQRAK